MPSDAELLLKYQSERSNGNFNPIVQRHGPMVLYTCLRRLGNMHDAEDAAQETFAVLSRKANEITGSLSGWLHAVALHTANQMVRTRVRRVRREKELATMKRNIGIADVAESDWKEEIDAAMVELPDDLREAVILRYLEGLKHEEVASRTGCAVSTTAWRSDQGLNRLRSILARRGVTLSVGSLAALLLHEAEVMAATSSAALATLTAATSATSASVGSTTGAFGKLVALLKTPWIVATTAVVATAGIATSVALWPGSAPPPKVITQPTAIFDTGKKGTRGHTFALNDKFVATGNSDQTIEVWELTNPNQSVRLGGTGDDSAVTLAFVPSPSQGQLATADHAGAVKLWNLETRAEVAALPVQPRPIQSNSIAFSPDGKLLAAGAWNGALNVCDVETRRERYMLRHAHDDGVMTVRFSSDGKLLASGSYDGIVKLWDADSGKPLLALPTHGAGGLVGLAFSRDGVLASGGMDRQIKIWNWADGTVKLILKGHTDSVNSVCWSPDGKLLASGSKDNTVRLWDTRSGHLLAIYECQDQVLQVEFTPDGKSLVTGGWNPPLKMWTVAR
jgi:RNA polymerase sigma factor (sigma-70 family)